MSFWVDKGKKGVENVASDHLSRITKDCIPESPSTNEHFSDEHLLAVSQMPWYAHTMNWPLNKCKYYFPKNYIFVLIIY